MLYKNDFNNEDLKPQVGEDARKYQESVAVFYAATLVKTTCLTFTTALFGLDYESNDYLSVYIRVRNARRLSSAGSSFIAGYGISRGNVNLDTLCKAVIDGVRTGVATGASYENHITIIVGKCAGC